MQKGDIIKRAIAEVAFQTLMDGTRSTNHVLEEFQHRTVRVDDVTMQLFVHDPSKGLRVFTVKVTENWS